MSILPGDPHPASALSLGKALPRPWLAHYEAKVPPEIVPSEQTLPQALQGTVQRFGERPALLFLGASTSYRALWGQVQRFASALLRSGLQPGDRVSIMLPNCPQFVVCFYGTLLAGGMVVNTSPLFVAHELEQQLLDSGSETLVILDSLFPRYAELRPRLTLKRVFVAGIQDALPFPKNLLYPLKARQAGNWVKVRPEAEVLSLRQVLRDVRLVPSFPTVGPDEVALLQYTGGTTGTPKGAMLTHRNLLFNAQQACIWVSDLRPGQEVNLSAIPFFHVYGMTTCMNMSVVSGSAMALIPDARNIKMILQEIARSKPTLFPGVPTLYNAINNHPETPNYDLTSIRACISGSAPLLQETLRRFKELTGGANLLEGYGLTEASPISHSNPLFGEQRPGTVGLPFPSILAMVVNDQGEPLPPGEPGELWLSGPTIMKGYWKKPEETAQTLVQAQGRTWLRTGDIATMDPDGYFRIVDRQKDLIIVSGHNVYPREVEEVLTTHPAVLEAAAVGLPDEYRGEQVHAVVYLRPGQPVSAEELREYCKAYLSPYKVPRSIDFAAQELPKSAALKILRRQVAAEALEKRKRLVDR